MKNLIKIITNCFIGLSITFLLLILVINFFCKDSGIVKIGKYSFFNVVGDSMYPKIKEGDFIVVNSDVKEKYNVGDVVSFLSETEEGYMIITHEVVEIKDSSDSLKYITKGINNDKNDEKVLLNNEIIGEYTGFRVPLLGYVIEFLRTNLGYFLLIVLPLGFVLLISIYELIKEMYKIKKGEL